MVCQESVPSPTDSSAAAAVSASGAVPEPTAQNASEAEISLPEPEAEFSEQVSLDILRTSHPVHRWVNHSACVCAGTGCIKLLLMLSLPTQALFAWQSAQLHLLQVSAP